MEDEQRLREIAHEIWVAEGYQVGEEERHWRTAKDKLNEEQEAARAADKPAKDRKKNKIASHETGPAHSKIDETGPAPRRWSPAPANTMHERIIAA